MIFLRYISSTLISAVLLTLLLLPPALAQEFCNPNAVETAPAAEFIDNGDGTATHTPTGLMWKRCIQGQSDVSCNTGAATFLNWEQALATAQNETFAGHSDWRLPSIKELMSITEYGCVNPAINEAVFPIRFPTGALYWSSTPLIPTSNQSSGNENRSFTQTVATGLPRANPRTDTHLMRLVRDTGQ